MIGVRAPLASYRVAITELPERARSANDPRGSIVVVGGGTGWFARAVSAVEAGAAGLVVADPAVEVSGISGFAESDLRGVPVALDRELLRPDVAAEISREQPASVLTATCAAPAAAFDRTICDAVGWLRVLAGGPLQVTALQAGDGGLIMAVEGRGCPGGVLARVLVEPTAVPRLRVSAIGAVRSEVSAAAAAATVVRMDDERGTLIAPARFETRQRLALRRAIAAVTNGTMLDDLHEFAIDAEIALAGRRALSP
ncbi:MAG: hypothetical protein EPO52_08215 [Herbiconiux sp.]|uniref:hypothetical protein n=1 Tax=Herbiconiux sp. TaxID=1871186 RepID=UPI0011F63068|nr:hypothetical protein [Herbiconiux sp.]TAJ48149.1 MAG: hypothetical protein EPO52_08215 [Herbiconiux sp.]